MHPSSAATSPRLADGLVLSRKVGDHRSMIGGTAWDYPGGLDDQSTNVHVVQPEHGPGSWKRRLRRPPMRAGRVHEHTTQPAVACRTSHRAIEITSDDQWSTTCSGHRQDHARAQLRLARQKPEVCHRHVDRRSIDDYGRREDGPRLACPPAGRHPVVLDMFERPSAQQRISELALARRSRRAKRTVRQLCQASHTLGLFA